MGRIRKPVFTTEQRSELEEGYQHGKQHCFRQRCQMLLLKSQGLSSKSVGELLDACEVSVNTWLDRWESSGIAGLKNRPGQGKKPILDETSDREIVHEAVRRNRQQLKLARLEVETELKKKLSVKTLKRFLKKVADDSSGYGNVRAIRPMRHSTPTR
jgi:transposase